MALTKFQKNVEVIIQEIDGLYGKLEVSCSSSEGVVETEEKVRIKSEICRKFVLLDYIFELEDERGDLREEEVEILEELKDDVIRLRLEVMYRRLNEEEVLDELNEMPILPVKNREPATRPDPGYFPNYLELPGPVVRKRILDNLNSSQDKLNLIKAIPCEGHLMGWDDESLLFEMVYEILIKRDELPPQDIYSLSQVSEELRDVVKKNFDELLRSLAKCEEFYTNQVVPLNQLDGYFPEEDMDNNENGKYLLNPYPAQILLDFQRNDQNEASMALLERVGKKIWDFRLQFGIALHLAPIEKMEIISSCLRLMPNLRRFVVHGGMSIANLWERPTPQFLHAQWALIDKVPLPDLAHLKTLEIEGQCQGFEVVNQKLLGKYAKQLHCLATDYEYPTFGALEESVKLSAPYLSTLKLFGREEHYSRQIFEWDMKYLSIVKDLPLKVVYFDLPEENIKARTEGLLTFLSIHFGRTLKCLQLFIRRSDEEPADAPPAAPTPGSAGSSWLCDLQFPKLKSFAIDFSFCSSVEIGLDYLLRFPALEKLEFFNIMVDADVIYRQPFLHLSYFKRKMLVSNLWKLMPRLNSYHLKYLDNDYCETHIERHDCLWSQRNGKEIPPHLLPLESKDEY